MRSSFLLAATICTATQASQPVTFTVDPSRSFYQPTVTLTVGNFSASNQSGVEVSGFIEAVVTDPTQPTQIRWDDHALSTDDDLNVDVVFNPGAGSGSVGFSTVMAAYGSVVNAGPVDVNGGVFAFPSLNTDVSGDITYSYNVLFTGSGNGTTDLDQDGQTASAVTGTLVHDAGLLTLTTLIPVRISLPEVDGSLSIDLGGNLSLVATATLDDPACSVADLAPPFGITDLDDVDAFIPLFLAADPAADIALPTGIIDLADIDAFIAAFIAGCP
ncbi:MAG: GC-type dockerin domain-anchored protein [Planctomycetota bacterium]